jgi:hypothetical protein
MLGERLARHAALIAQHAQALADALEIIVAVVRG